MNAALSPVELLACLQRGEPVLLPTDTVPALAIRPRAAGTIWMLKQRPAHKPLILMGADQRQLEEALAMPWLAPWCEEARKAWPGAVTLVLPDSGPLRQALNPEGERPGAAGSSVPHDPGSAAAIRAVGHHQCEPIRRGPGTHRRGSPCPLPAAGHSRPLALAVELRHPQ